MLTASKERDSPVDRVQDPSSRSRGPRGARLLAEHTVTRTRSTKFLNKHSVHREVGLTDRGSVILQLTSRRRTEEPHRDIRRNNEQPARQVKIVAANEPFLG